MIISRFCRQLSSVRVPTCKVPHQRAFGPPTQKVSQIFREIKEWQLAKIFCQHSLQPNIVLAGRFCYGLVALEKAINRKLPNSITDRIWDAIAPKKLKRLDDAYARALQ